MRDPLSSSSRIAIVGSGPAALMAADRLAKAGHTVSVFDKRPGIAWKLFVAGSSGLNITNDAPPKEFAKSYTGPAEHWSRCLANFSARDWVDFIEVKLEQKTFLGTSGRYFVETMHAAKLVRAWKKRLESSLAVKFFVQHELKSFTKESDHWQLSFANSAVLEADFVLFCLGGGSYEPTEQPLRWPPLFEERGLGFIPFEAVNTGYHIAWPEAFLNEADGLPLKNIVFSNAKGTRKGDLIVTRYGLEGTPVYTLGEPGPFTLDLKPDLSLEAIKSKLQGFKENLSLIRRAQKSLSLNKAALALIFHLAPDEWKKDIDAFALGIKSFPLRLLEPRPLAESISSRGGIAWDELDENLQLKKLPGLFVAGEMIDWEAPTGGFLIQGAVSQGAWVADRICELIAGHRIQPPRR